MKTGRLAVGLGVVVAVALAGYGIWSRHRDIDHLRADADDTAVTRVQALSPKPAPAEASLTLPGQVEAWNEAQIYAQVSGYIKKWYVDYGAHVTGGQLLATIDTPSLDAQYEASQAQLKVAQARQNIAELTARRFDALRGTGYERQQEIDDKDADALATKAATEAAQQNVDHFKALQDFKRIVAPFDGVVTARRVNIGDFIDASGADDSRSSVTGSSTSGRAPFSVGEITKLRVFVAVPQSLGYVLKPGLNGVLHPLEDPSKSIPASYLTAAGAVQTATRTIVTEFEVGDATSSGLMPGAYVDVEMTYPSAPGLLVIPSQALLFRAGGMQVALIEGDHVRLRDVKLGNDLGLTVQVTGGLSPSDRIVANPSLGLLDGAKVQLVASVPGYQAGSTAARSPATDPGPAVPASTGGAQPSGGLQAAGGGTAAGR